ncbi:serine/threonine-protein kinase HAL4/sat4 [Linnemannia zychae]|nr:serine/threonine-protein kinase HAL4/sat4 [Linnemannia zychae]
MSFHVPGEELDFTIYGDANTNQLQLSPSQHRLLQRQRFDLAVIQDLDDEGGHNLTGYHSGIFDATLERKAHRESRKRQTSVAFVNVPRISLVNVESSHQQQQQLQQQKSRKASRPESMKIDTSVETIHGSDPRLSQTNALVHKPHSPQQQQSKQSRSCSLSKQSQSFPNLDLNPCPVTDQMDNDNENHTPAMSAISVVESGDNSPSQIPCSDSPSKCPLPRYHLLSTLSPPSQKHYTPKVDCPSDNEENKKRNLEMVVQGLEVTQHNLRVDFPQDGLAHAPQEEMEEPIHATALRPPIARSATIISTTSSNGRLRLTHRLSYLAHLQDLDADDEDDVVSSVITPVDPNTLFQQQQQQQPTPASLSAISTFVFTSAKIGPASAPVIPSVSMAPMFSTRRTSLPAKQSVSPLPPPPPKHGMPLNSVGLSHKPSLPQSSHQSATTPSIPKLYKRLLRVFKPPTESSDSDNGGNTQSTQLPPGLSSNDHNHIDLPSIPGCNQSVRNSTGRSISKSAPTSKRPSLSNAPPVSPPIVLPSLAEIANTAENVPPHKVPESTSNIAGSGGGFRAKFLRKLRSSPNLHATVYSVSTNSVPSSQVDLAKLDISLANLQAINGNRGVADQPPSPYSPLPSDFEHDLSCPAGQKMMERRAAGRPRSATTSRVPPPMPTLQSKYGTPGRELGAGTQAQVMLLRVKSSKRLRAHKNKNTSSPVSQPHIHYQQQQNLPPHTRGAFSPVNQEAGVSNDAFLTPYPRTGTLITTTEDEVTPEQREAYRKRLLRRNSTGGLSMTYEGGLIYAIKKFRPPRTTETHRQFLKKVCAEFCISTSMDHENIIRTLDLVRDQPGQELVDDDDIYSQSVRHKRQHCQRHSAFHSGCDMDDGDKSDNGYVRTEQHRREEARECNCPRNRHRRTQSIKSTRTLYTHGSNLPPVSPTSCSSLSNKHRPIARKSVISKPQRKRSIDITSNRHSIVRNLDRPPTPQSIQEKTGSRRQRHFNHWKSNARQFVSPPSSSSASVGSNAHALSIIWKKKQQYEQVVRKKEVLKLKQQKEREKQHAKQLKMDQFPEYCMVMEFAAGGDLFNLLTKSHPPISLHEKHCLWRQLLNGVQYMHSMGVAHRDLKPENILIDGTGRILKITDFGIANVFKSVGDPIPLPCRGIIGSEPYIAPEEFYQEEYDPRAVDVWACGIIFYVMYYAAMPWARADRKKDARFNRYINDIMSHRHTETQRRLHYERRQLHQKNSYDRQSCGSNGSASTRSGSDAWNHPHEVSHLRQYPPYNPNAETSSITSSRSGSPTSPRGCITARGDSTSETPQSSLNSSPISFKPLSPTSEALASSAGSTAFNPLGMSVVPPTVYNTFGYNGFIGGHEFIDRIETPGCRRVLYAILEPDARKRITIDQVIADEWISRIRYCTDNHAAQEEQMRLVFGAESQNMNEGEKGRYLSLPNGQPHHRHVLPKKVKTI